MILDFLKQVDGGVGSLPTTKLWTKFPANREINREFSDLCLRDSAPNLRYPAESNAVAVMCANNSFATEQGIFNAVSGNYYRDIRELIP